MTQFYVLMTSGSDVFLDDGEVSPLCRTTKVKLFSTVGDAYRKRAALGSALPCKIIPVQYMHEQDPMRYAIEPKKGPTKCPKCGWHTLWPDGLSPTGIRCESCGPIERLSKAAA